MDRLVLMRRPDVMATRRFASRAILRITLLNESEFPSAGTLISPVVPADIRVH
jgi:hypothetical protein